MKKKSTGYSCNDCDVIDALNNKICSIADKRLYNIRYELNREVDYGLYHLLSFYKEMLEGICEEECFDPSAACSSGCIQENPCNRCYSQINISPSWICYPVILHPCITDNGSGLRDEDKIQNIIERIRIITS